MKTAIILHGMPSKEEYFDLHLASPSNQHWLPWIQRQLVLNGVLAQTLELPEPYAPDYEKWRNVFEQMNIDEETDLIGHSCGAGFLVRWLSENKRRVGKVVLVAPFLDPDHDEVESDFFQFEIDKQFPDRTLGTTIFVSPQDNSEILQSVELLRSCKPISILEIPNKGHFTFDDMGTEEFVELRTLLI